MEKLTGRSRTGSAGSRRILSEDVYETLREMLFDQVLEPGSKLVIDQLADRLQVSRTPVREALARLESDGLITRESHKGYSVTPTMDPTSFLHLFQMRMLLEPPAAYLAARNAKEPDLEDLAAAIERLRVVHSGRRYTELRTFSSADALFHETVAKASGNPYLHEAIVRLRSHERLARLPFQHGAVDHRIALPEHQGVLEAIERRDADTAGQLMRAHIQRSRSHLLEMLSRDPPTALDIGESFEEPSKGGPLA